jgi:ketosteroid isomerase-like protein
MRGRFALLAAVTAGCGAAVGGALSGCGAVSVREQAAAEVAQRFVDAVARGDGDAACAVLAPDTVAALEDAAGGGCAEAVLDEDIAAPGPVEVSDVYGQWARVVLPGDTLFLAVFRGGWRIVAAGCRPAGEGPYDCALQGG